MNAPIKGILWDFDGTLASTERAVCQARIDVLKDLFPLATNDLHIDQVVCWWTGKSGDDIITDIKTRYPALALPTNMQDRFTARAQERLNNHPLEWSDAALPPLLATLASKFSMAVGSNGDHRIVHGNIEKLGAGNIFTPDRIFTVRDVAPGRGKPFPDIFNHAADTLGLKSDEVIVVGDSLADLAAAQSAGMKFVAYTGCAPDKDAAIQRLKDNGATTIIRHYSDFPKI